ncbi:MAG: hypothetical protein ACLGHQ_02590 [Acidimicrobiia bacterium]
MHQYLPHHPYSSVLRQRSAHLLDLAARVERSLVMQLDEAPSALARRLLDRNLHQLHLAVDDLRDSADRFRRRADELDLAVMVAS